MADQYNFTWSDPSKPGFVVQPQTKDTTTTPLTLTGRGSPNWGQDLQQNLIKMLEHFASPTPPSPAINGQLWYNSATKLLHVFDSSASSNGGDPWAKSVGGAAVASTTPPANPDAGTLWWNPTTGALSVWDTTKWGQLYPIPYVVKVAGTNEYNAMAALINQVTGAPQGTTLASSFGWGQTDTLPTITKTTDNSSWLALIAKLNQIYAYLGLPTTNIYQPGFVMEYGIQDPLATIQNHDGIVSILAGYQNTLVAVNALVTGNARYKPAANNLEATVPASGTATRNAVWSGTISHEVIGTFASQAAMNAFFNAGGQFQFFSSLTNAGTNRDFQWMNFCGNVGTVKFAVDGCVDSANRSNTVGLYDLTSSYKLIYSVANPQNANQVFTINAKLDSNKVIHFQLQYTDPGTLYGGVGGTLTSATTLVRPSSTMIKSPVNTYPTVTQTALA